MIYFGTFVAVLSTCKTVFRSLAAQTAYQQKASKSNQKKTPNPCLSQACWGRRHLGTTVTSTLKSKGWLI